MQLATEGSFLCEVSGEAPLFQTAKKQNFLTVVGKQFQRSRQYQSGIVRGSLDVEPLN